MPLILLKKIIERLNMSMTSQIFNKKYFKKFIIFMLTYIFLYVILNTDERSAYLSSGEFVYI